MVRLWECSIGKGVGYILGGWGSVTYILVEKWGIFWKEGVDYGIVAYSCQERGYLLWEGGVDSGRVAYRCLKGDASYRCLKGGILWDGRGDSGIKRHYT